MPQDVLVEEQKCGNRNCRNAFQFRLRRTYGALFNLCVPVRVLCGTPLLWDATTMVKDILEGDSYETKEFSGMSCDC